MRVKWDEETLPLNKIAKAETDVVWNQKGHDRLIPLARIRDYLRYTKFPRTKSYTPPVEIHWSETEPLPVKPKGLTIRHR